MKNYRATITPTVSGGNIEVTICANSVYQAQKLIETLKNEKSSDSTQPLTASKTLETPVLDKKINNRGILEKT